VDKKAKTYLIIAAVVLLFLVGFGIYFYRKGKRQTTIAPVVKDIPGSSASDNNPAGTSNAEIKMISENLYNEMKGTNITGHAPQPYAALLALSDTDFEKV
jgi:flagellar basal body-associated protein FliL